jgi:hypothetical protein
MILYVNGNSHTAADEDDGYPELGRQPHPANLRVS